MFFFFFSSRRRHTRLTCDWSSDVCSSDLIILGMAENRGPNEWSRFGIPLGDVFVDGGLQADDGVEAAASDALSGHGREERLHHIEPGAGGWREVECPAWMPSQPGVHLGMRVGCIVVDDGVDDPADGYLAFDGVEEADELLVPMVLHAEADHGALQHIERSEQCGRAMALVVVLVWTATDGIDVPE